MPFWNFWTNWKKKLKNIFLELDLASTADFSQKHVQESYGEKPTNAHTTVRCKVSFVVHPYWRDYRLFSLEKLLFWRMCPIPNQIRKSKEKSFQFSSICTVWKKSKYMKEFRETKRGKAHLGMQVGRCLNGEGGK